MSHTVDALEYALKAESKVPVDIRLRSIYPAEVEDLGTCLQKRQRGVDDLRDRVGLTEWLAQYDQMPVNESQMKCDREKLHQAMREVYGTYALFPILWRYQGSDEVHELIGLKPSVVPVPLSSRYNVGPACWGEPEPVKEEFIQYPPQLVRKMLKRYRGLVLENQQLRFDRSVDQLRRSGRTRLANRRIIIDLVHHWPRRDGRYT